MRLANEKERSYSRLIDLTILFLVIYIWNYPRSSFIYSLFLSIMSGTVYFPLVHSIFSRSIGDFILGLKLLDSKGKRIGPSLAIFRFFTLISNTVFSQAEEAAKNPFFTNSNTDKAINEYVDFVKEININSTKAAQELYEKVSQTYEKDSGTYLVNVKNVDKAT